MKRNKSKTVNQFKDRNPSDRWLKKLYLSLDYIEYSCLDYIKINDSIKSLKEQLKKEKIKRKLYLKDYRRSVRDEYNKKLPRYIKKYLKEIDHDLTYEEAVYQYGPF
jgi:hypothetical protein